MAEKIKITGNVIENTRTLEYATVTVINSKAQNCSWRYHKSENLILMYPREFIPLKLSLFL
jgi:hypothetical protein